MDLQPLTLTRTTEITHVDPTWKPASSGAPRRESSIEVPEEEESFCETCGNFLHECFSDCIQYVLQLFLSFPCIRALLMRHMQERRENNPDPVELFISTWKYPRGGDAQIVAAAWRSGYEALPQGAKSYAEDAFYSAHPEYHAQIPRNSSGMILEENLLIENQRIREALDQLIITHVSDPNVLNALEGFLRDSHLSPTPPLPDYDEIEEI